MATSTGPYAVALGTVLQLAPAQTTGVYFSVVQIANSSPFLATVMVSGNQFLLQPFMADLYTLPTGGQPVSATFSQVPGGPSSAPGSTGSFCTATWYLPSDQITDAFPVALTAAAIMSALYTGPSSQSAGGGAVFTTTGLGPLAFSTGLPALTAKWAMMSAAISAATVTTTGVMRLLELATGLIMEIPFPATFTSFAETLTIAFPAGGLAVPPGGFTLQAVFSSTGGVLAAVTGHASALIGY